MDTTQSRVTATLNVIASNRTARCTIGKIGIIQRGTIRRGPTAGGTSTTTMRQMGSIRVDITKTTSKRTVGTLTAAGGEIATIEDVGTTTAGTTTAVDGDMTMMGGMHPSRTIAERRTVEEDMPLELAQTPTRSLPRSIPRNLSMEDLDEMFIMQTGNDQQHGLLSNRMEHLLDIQRNLLMLHLWKILIVLTWNAQCRLLLSKLMEHVRLCILRNPLEKMSVVQTRNAQRPLLLLNRMKHVHLRSKTSLALSICTAALLFHSG